MFIQVQLLMEKLTRRWLKDFVFTPSVSIVIATAARLNIFKHMKEPLTPEELGNLTRCSPKGLKRLLDVLTSLGLVEKKNGTYFLNSQVEAFLGRDDHFSNETYLDHVFSIMKAWLHLPETLMTGKPIVSEKDPNFFVNLTRGLFAINWTEAEEFYKHLSTFQAEKILDVGAGSCLWSLPFVKNDNYVKATAIDFPNVLNGSARPIVQKEGCIDRYNFIEGDYWEVSWGEDYDLIILGHICHSLSPDENIALFKKASRALNAQGVLTVIDFIPDEDRVNRIFPLVFSINMLLQTEKGDVYSFSEFNEMLAKAGFEEVTLFQLDEGFGADVIVAVG